MVMAMAAVDSEKRQSVTNNLFWDPFLRLISTLWIFNFDHWMPDEIHEQACKILSCWLQNQICNFHKGCFWSLESFGILGLRASIKDIR